VTGLTFSKRSPHILGVGLHDGTIAVFDVRSRQPVPLLSSTAQTGRHSGPVWKVLYHNLGCQRHRTCPCSSLLPARCLLRWSRAAVAVLVSLAKPDILLTVVMLQHISASSVHSILALIWCWECLQCYVHAYNAICTAAAVAGALVDRGPEREEMLVSVATDGKVKAWTIAKGLEHLHADHAEAHPQKDGQRHCR